MRWEGDQRPDMRIESYFRLLWSDMTIPCMASASETCAWLRWFAQLDVFFSSFTWVIWIGWYSYKDYVLSLTVLSVHADSGFMTLLDASTTIRNARTNTHMYSCKFIMTLIKQKQWMSYIHSRIWLHFILMVLFRHSAAILQLQVN